jgi:hypothetical protein
MELHDKGTVHSFAHPFADEYDRWITLYCVRCDGAEFNAWTYTHFQRRLQLQLISLTHCPRLFKILGTWELQVYLTTQNLQPKIKAETLVSAGRQINANRNLTDASVTLLVLNP